MRGYSNALKAGILSLSMIAAMPAFTQSAHAGPAPSVDITALQKDPVHEAALKASANKIVFVLGEGFGRRALNGLREDLSGLNLVEGKHFEIVTSAATPNGSGVFYVGGVLMLSAADSEPYVFDQYAAEDAISLIRRAIKAGTITLAAVELTP